MKTLYLRTAVIDYPQWYPRKNPRVKVMMDSIRTMGMLSPITVRKKRTRYEVISGVLRLKAWKRLGRRRIRCVILKDPDYIRATITMNLAWDPRPTSQALRRAVRR